jgi:hypothetical protein
MNHPHDDIYDLQGGDASEFELMLRNQSLGPAPSNRSELLYRCGYAAGVAAAATPLRHSALRWRRVGLAASFIACLSFASHFFKSNALQSNTKIVETRDVAKQMPSPAPEQLAHDSDTSLDGWSAGLARDLPQESRSLSSLRTSAHALNQIAADEQIAAPVTVPSDGGGRALRPSDFRLFL